MIYKKITALILSMFLAMSIAFTGCNKTDGSKSTSAGTEKATSDSTNTPSLGGESFTIRSINKYGTVLLNVTFEELKEKLNIEIGDIIGIVPNKNDSLKVYQMPVGTSFSDVDTGSMLMRFDIEDNEVGLAVNNGSFVEKTGIGTKKVIAEDPGYEWDVSVTEVLVTLIKKGGYLDELKIRQLERTNAREDYPELTDEEFANFRAVNYTGIKKDYLFRSSTPVEPALGRNEYAMAAMEKYGIKTVLNLDDDYATMVGYETFAGSYYSKCAILNQALSYDLTTEEFKAGIKQCVEFVLENKGPILAHCKEGKDRSAFFCEIVGSYLGATYDELVEDYMKSYTDYYRVEKGSKTWDIILSVNFTVILQKGFGIEDLKTANLKSAAEKYLLSCGLTSSQLEALKVLLSD